MLFFQDQLQNLSIVSAIFGHKIQNDLHRGQPLAVLSPNESIWPVCRVFRFLKFLVRKYFYLEKIQRFFIFFSSPLGTKKMRFVHTTKLASECMWKAHFWPRKMRPKTFSIGIWTWLTGFYSSESQHNSGVFPILYKQFLTFNSTLVVNYPKQASFQGNWVFLTAFLFQRANWIVSAGPSGHLKQSIQTHFQTTLNLDNLDEFKSNEVAAKLSHISHKMNYLLVGTILVFRQRLNSDQYRKTYRKTLSMKQLWTTLADRRRAGPPAFRRKYRKMP